jgi:hypothetical protein
VDEDLHTMIEVAKAVRAPLVGVGPTARRAKAKRDAQRRHLVAFWVAEAAHAEVLAAGRAAADLVQLEDPPSARFEQRIDVPRALFEQLAGAWSVRQLGNVVDLVHAVVVASSAARRHRTNLT